MNLQEQFEAWITMQSPIDGANIDFNNGYCEIVDGVNLHKDEYGWYRNAIVNSLYMKFILAKRQMEIRHQIMTQPPVIL